MSKEFGFTTKDGPGLLTIQLHFKENYGEILMHFFPRKGLKERHWGYEKEFWGSPWKSFGLGPLFSAQWLIT